jgi:hypothetical protein
MIGMLRKLLLAALLAPQPAHAGAAAPGLDVAISAAPGADVLRLALPAAALAATRTPGLADVRIADRTGALLPMALLTPRPAAKQQSQTDLPALPILGRPGALRVTGLSIRIAESAPGSTATDGSARVAGVVGTLEPGVRPVVLGTLFDTRRIVDAVQSLRLDADLPAMQPITIILDASADLQHWDTLAEQRIYRAAAASDATVIALPGVLLNGRYLRVRWQADTPLIGPVIIRSGRLITARQQRPALLRVATRGAIADGPHALLLALPTALPLAAIALMPAHTSVLVPVRIFGRADREQPWAELGSGRMARLRSGTADPVALQPGAISQIRIVADARTAGFTSVPQITLLFKPVDLAFVASGRPPYRLIVAAPQFGTRSPWLPADALVATPDREVDLPVATLAATTPMLDVTPATNGLPRRVLLLWAILLAGAALMAWMAIRLIRR